MHADLYSEQGTDYSTFDRYVRTNITWLGNVTKQFSRHTLKFGAEVRRIRLNNSGNTLTTSSVSYATNEDFINNVADSATEMAA